MGIWVHPHTDMPVKVWGGCWRDYVGVDLSQSYDKIPWSRLIVPVECNSHSYDMMYGKCFRALICYYEYDNMGKWVHPHSVCLCRYR